MSTLQISLAILGGVLLALIVLYNIWTARRNAPKRAQPQMKEAAAGPQRERNEPALDLLQSGHLLEPVGPQTIPLAQAAQEAGPDARQEPGLQGEQQAAAPGLAPERRAILDALIDVIAPIQPEHVIPGEGAMHFQPTTRRAGSKPFHIEGLNQQSRQWEPLQAGSRYTAFQAGVQLANRVGALNEIEFSEFTAKAQAFADALSASVDLPDMLQEVARARELDQFASEHDAQLTFMLRARQAAWSSGYLQQNAARLGFVSLSMPGRMALPTAAGGSPLLVLSYDAQAAQAEDLDHSAIREFFLSLDVPQVHRSEQPFARLREAAEALCSAMDGVLCDQNGHPLPLTVLEPIAADLEHLYDQLDSRELSAGSTLARRLFS